MTITIAWIRKINQTAELVVASDSRLRSQGAIDQAQKLFPLDRGDCCLAFCGDAQIAYPLFVQASTAVNSFIKTRTRGMDVHDVSAFLLKILNNLIDSWDLSTSEKSQSLKGTRILFAGWSWRHQKYEIGFYEHGNTGFKLHHRKVDKLHPWHETTRSLVFIGDYQNEYITELKNLMSERRPIRGLQSDKIVFDYDYEPIEALHRFMKNNKKKSAFNAVGGAPQMIKIYSYASTKIFVVKTQRNSHFLLGRKMFSWEKTEYPIIDLTKKVAKIIYPMQSIPTINQNRDNSRSRVDDDNYNVE